MLPKIVVTGVAAISNVKATMARGTLSLATLLLFVTACSLFAGLIPLFVRSDHQVFVASWGGLVALQLLGAAHIRTASVLDNAHKTRRQEIARLAFQITLAAGLVPCLMLMLFLAMDVAGPGAISQALQAVFIPLAIVFVPVGALAILAAMVLQTLGNFSFAAIATQAVSFCSTIWPYIYFWFLD